MSIEVFEMVAAAICIRLAKEDSRVFELVQCAFTSSSSHGVVLSGTQQQSQQMPHRNESSLLPVWPMVKTIAFLMALVAEQSGAHEFNGSRKLASLSEQKSKTEEAPDVFGTTKLCGQGLTKTSYSFGLDLCYRGCFMGNSGPVSVRQPNRLPSQGNNTW